jgi:ATP-dependent 26S proteasome regulatory subunit/predicted nucleic acid-binding protein
MPARFLDELDTLIRARYTLIYLLTHEEDRARRLLVRIAEQQQKMVFEWSVTDGLRCVYGSREQHGGGGARAREPLAVLNEILQTDLPALYVLKDFHPYFDRPDVVRQMRDLGSALRFTKKTVIMLSPTLSIPDELDKSVSIIDMPLPDFSELSEMFDSKIGAQSSGRRYEVRLDEGQREAIVKAALGLTMTEAENAFAVAIVRDNILDVRDIDAVIAEKRQVIRKSGVLEYYHVDDQLANVGGFDILKDWLQKRVRAFTEDARKYGLPQPSGILLMGVQGCGKSLIAKTIASSWQLPLLRLDMSRIFEGYIGSSEQNMRKAVKVAESLAPCVLWIDEIEKAFAGVEGSGASDSGTTARVVGTFLTWIQEKSEAVFVVATANDVAGLPPELLRKGRLDEIFFVDLPRGPEREEIFGIHLRKVKRDPSGFDLPALVKHSKGFSGAEIEQAIFSAMHDSFFEDRELQSSDIVRSLTETVPLSTTMREKIGKLRTWAVDRARPVSRLQKASSESGDGSL